MLWNVPTSSNGIWHLFQSSLGIFWATHRRRCLRPNERGTRRTTAMLLWDWANFRLLRRQNWCTSCLQSNKGWSLVEMQLVLPSLQDIQHLQSEVGAETKYYWVLLMDFSWRSVVSTNTMVWHFEAFLDINLAVNLLRRFWVANHSHVVAIRPSRRRNACAEKMPRKWLSFRLCRDKGIKPIDRICMCSLRHETSLDYRMLLLWPWHYLNAITSMPLGQRGRTNWRGAQTLGGLSMFGSQAFCVPCQCVSHSCNSFQVDIFMRLYHVLYKW